jgi:hypothetical protein
MTQRYEPPRNTRATAQGWTCNMFCKWDFQRSPKLFRPSRGCVNFRIMGRSSFPSSRSSINGNLNIEGLPLYSDLTITPPADLTAPSEEATPDEVRSFLVQLLVQD